VLARAQSPRSTPHGGNTASPLLETAMSEIPALHSTVRGWLLDGPLAAHVPAYVARLKRGDYAVGTMRRCLAGVGQFTHWMALCRLSAKRLDESRVDQFLNEHLPHCGCPPQALRHPREAHAALMPILAILRERGVITDLPRAAGPIAEELERYDAHMRDVRGLAAGTRDTPLRRSRPRDEGASPGSVAPTRSGHTTVQGTRLATGVPAAAVEIVRSARAPATAPSQGQQPAPCTATVHSWALCL